MNSFSKNSLITFFTQVVVFIFGFIASIILARVLGPDDRGIYAILILIPGVLAMIGNLGIGTANIYFGANRKYKLENILSNSLVCAVGFSVLLSLIFLIISTTTFFQNYLNSNNINPFHLWLAMAVFPLLLLYNFLRSVLLSREKIIRYNIPDFLQSISFLILIVLLLIVLKEGVFGAILSYIFSFLVATILVIIWISAFAKIRFSFNFNLFKDSIFFGGKAYLGNIAQFLNYRLGMFLAGYFLNTAAVGYYAVSVGIVERLWLVPGAMALVLFPRVSAIGDKKANILTPQVVRHTLFIVFLLSLVLIFFAKPFIQILYGTSYLPSIVPLLVLLPGIIALSISKILVGDLVGRGKPEIGMVASFVSLIANILLIILLAPKWGLAGIAFASTIAYFLTAVMIIIQFSKFSKISLRELLIIKKRDFQLYINLLKWMKFKT